MSPYLLRRPKSDRAEIDEFFLWASAELGDRLRFLPNLSKGQFYALLARCQVVWSSALQENFGYSVLEACTLGVTPVLPSRLAYPEMYPEEYLYRSDQVAYDMVVDYLRHPRPLCGEVLRDLDGTTRVGQALSELTKL